MGRREMGRAIRRFRGRGGVLVGESAIAWAPREIEQIRAILNIVPIQVAPESRPVPLAASSVWASSLLGGHLEAHARPHAFVALFVRSL